MVLGLLACSLIQFISNNQSPKSLHFIKYTHLLHIETDFNRYHCYVAQEEVQKVKPGRWHRARQRSTVADFY